MKIQVINPNTSQSMTASIGRAARRWAPRTKSSHGTTRDGVHRRAFDEAIAAVGVLEEVRNRWPPVNDNGHHDLLVTPCLLAAREMDRARHWHGRSGVMSPPTIKRLRGGKQPDPTTGSLSHLAETTAGPALHVGGCGVPVLELELHGHEQDMAERIANRLQARDRRCRRVPWLRSGRGLAPHNVSE